MKKIGVLIVFVLLSITSSIAQQKQGVKLEGFFSFPLGDLSDVSVFGLGADLGYVMDVSGKLQLGAVAGYQTFFGKSGSGNNPPALGGVSKQDIQFVPLAASARYYVFDILFVGTDLGYAVGLNTGNDGGFYYKPKVGISFGYASLATVISYTGVSLDGANLNAINLGFEVGF